MGIVEFFRDATDRFLGGHGKSSITVPVMDGPLKPNDLLEKASVKLEQAGIGNLVRMGDGLLFSSGNRILIARPGKKSETFAQFEAEIMSLAAGPDCSIAIGLDHGGVIVRAADGSQRCHVDATAANCPTAMVFTDAGTLVICNGSHRTGAHDWQRDLLELGRNGTVLRVAIASGEVEIVARDLGYPAGVCVGPDGSILVSEAWRHRLLQLSGDLRDPVPVLADLPAYPGRMCPAAEGGYWLAAFAVRSQLQEFVLHEHRYRRMMMAEVDPDFWIAPALSSGHSFKEPLQAGGVIRLGIHKPWAPTRSYGLVIRLDSEFAPVASAHSRAGGCHHGVTSIAETGRELLVAATGAGKLLKLAGQELKEAANEKGQGIAK